MSTFKTVIVKGKGYIKNDGTTNLKIRITHKNKVSYIPTDLFIFPASLDAKTGTLKSGKHKELVNVRLGDLIQKYRKLDLELGEIRQSMTVSQIRKFLLKGKTISPDIDFFNFADIIIKKTKNAGTAYNYTYLAKSLKNFAGDYLPFSDITFNFLQNYELYLHGRGAKNGIINYMKTFRALFNKARDHYNDEDSNVMPIPHYPFRKYTIPTREVKTKEHNITIDELKKLIDYKPELPGEEFAKDMFLLMFYLIGIEGKDLFYLNKPVNGRITYKRFKTSRNISIKLEKPAIDIIKKYNNSDLLINASQRFNFNRSFIKYVNNYLHGESHHNIIGIFTKLGIHKNVTTKWAKHTWGTIARNKCKIDKDNIALCLGHADRDNRVTDIYIDYDYSIIDYSNKKVLDFVKSNISNV